MALYFDPEFNDRRYQMPRIFPKEALKIGQLFPAQGIRVYSALMMLPYQTSIALTWRSVLPLYLYEETKPDEGLFATADGETASRAATPSPTRGWLISRPPIRARRSPRKTCSTTSTACCTRPTTASGSRTTSPRRCPASRRSAPSPISPPSAMRAAPWAICM